MGQLIAAKAADYNPDMILALERNTQAVNEEERNRTCVRVLKNRFSGESGPAALLQWTKQSGRLTEIPFNLNDDDTNEDEEDEFTDDRDFS